ncbi:MAG: DUF427 domain-containing protein, partial [Thermoleophilia bacterium]
MSLTVASGPFGRTPAGRLNGTLETPGGFILWDPVPHRVRARFAGRTVVDTRGAVLLHETNHLPVYYVPEADLDHDLLVPTETRTFCPIKGDCSYRSIRVGDRVATDAVWAYRAPIPSAPFLAGYAALVWDALDEWLVEDEQVHGHPRDPYHRIDVYPTSTHVRVLLDGEVLADSRRARVLYETSLPPRYYLPIEDVRVDLLEPSPTRTRCAYKGEASYWHARVGGRLVDDLVWSYPEPDLDAQPVRGLLCFLAERVDV